MCKGSNSKFIEKNMGRTKVKKTKWNGWRKSRGLIIVRKRAKKRNY